MTPRAPTTGERARWIAVGNVATGFLAFGNVVTGVIAIGNVARGFIAVGNVAIGVIAVGNVGVGILGGFGATLGFGLLAGAGVAALPVLGGVGGVVTLSQEAPVAAILPIVGWLLFSYLMPGRREAPAGPDLIPLDLIRRGELGEGWIAGRARRAGEGAVRVDQPGGSVELAAPPEVMRALGEPGGRGGRGRGGLEGRRALALVRGEERLAPHEGGYREGGQRELVLTCAALAPAPPRRWPWATPGEVQWWLARAFRVGAALGVVGLLIKLFRALAGG